MFRGLKKRAWKQIETLEWKLKRNVAPVPSEMVAKKDDLSCTYLCSFYSFARDVSVTLKSPLNWIERTHNPSNCIIEYHLGSGLIASKTRFRNAYFVLLLLLTEVTSHLWTRMDRQITLHVHALHVGWCSNQGRPSCVSKVLYYFIFPHQTFLLPFSGSTLTK